MLDLLYDLPLWLTGALFVSLPAAAAWACLGPVRRHLLPRFEFGAEHGHFGGAMVHSIMVFYGLVAALISVNVWESHTEVSRVVSHEASALAALYRDAGGYPEPTRSRLQETIRVYVEHIIRDAWPIQRRGGVPVEGLRKADAVQAVLMQFEPAHAGQAALHAGALRAYNSMVEARRLRLDANLERLPPAMWAVLIVGALISLFAAYLFSVDDPRLHALFVALLAMLIGLVLFMTFAMDHPYRGSLGVTAESYELVYEQLMKR